MRIRYGLALLLLSTIATAGVPYSTLAPKVTPEGEHIWTFAMQWNPKKLATTGVEPERWVSEAISGHLARQQLCDKGWEEIRRYEAGKNLVVEGRCKSA